MREARLDAVLDSAFTARVSPRSNLYAFEVPIPGLPKEFDGYTLLHLSDVHIHPRHVSRTTDLAHLETFLRRTGVKYDAVVLTGDIIVDKPSDLHPAGLTLLERLRGDRDAYFVLGNHDYYNGSAPHVRSAMTERGYRELCNESVTIERHGASITLTGLDDHLEGKPACPAPTNPGGTNLLITHNLDAVQRHTPDCFDLVLSGHLHGGEVRLGVFHGVQLMRLFGYAKDLNDQIVGWDTLTDRALSYVSPGQARHYLNFNSTRPGATLLTLRAVAAIERE